MNKDTELQALVSPAKLLGFAAYSGTGKTTLIEALLPELVAAGVRVGMVKHSHHRIEMDKPGKDSYRLRQAGASQLVLATPERSILFQEHADEPELEQQLALLQCDELDLVLVEGYRHRHFPKIELHRPEMGRPLLSASDSSIIAVASDQAISTELPQLDLNHHAQILSFILHWCGVSGE